MMAEEYRTSYVEVLRPYRQGSAGQYGYRVMGDEVANHIETLGQLMHRLVQELEAR